jgi:hypothetical protein
MMKSLMGVAVWLLLLPGILGSWGCLAPSGSFNFDQTDLSKETQAHGLNVHHSHPSESSGDSGAEQESGSQEPRIPINSPLFFSAASSVSVASAVLSGSSSAGSIINRFVDELKECGLHTFNNQCYTRRHVSRMGQRTLRLRTLFTCFMPAQAP